MDQIGKAGTEVQPGDDGAHGFDYSTIMVVELLAVSRALLLELIGGTQALATYFDEADRAEWQEVQRLYRLIDRSSAAIQAVSQHLAHPLVLD